MTVSSLLAGAGVSISQAGYNTLMEVVQARARAVAVPFAGGNETEQTLRARRLGRLRDGHLPAVAGLLRADRPVFAFGASSAEEFRGAGDEGGLSGGEVAGLAGVGGEVVELDGRRR